MPNKAEADSSQFKVMDNDSLVSLSEKQKSSFYKQIDINGAIVEKLSDGNFIMLPGYGKKGILFYDENVMEQMIANNVYPKETDTGTFYETYRNEIFGLKNKSDDSSITFFEHQFEKVSKMPFDYSFSITFLNKLEDFIKDNRMDKNKIDELYISTSILFNEGIRKQINADWNYDKQYTLNTFFSPYIQDNGIKIEINNSIHDLFYISSYKLGFKTLLINILEDYASQKLESLNASLLNKKLNENFEENYFKYFKAINRQELQNPDLN